MKLGKFTMVIIDSQSSKAGNASGAAMKKKASSRNRKNERDTMRREYDSSRAVRGLTAARYVPRCENTGSGSIALGSIIASHLTS